MQATTTAVCDRPRLAARGVCVSFGATRALDGVDLEARAGEVLAIVGQNGAGKSTLMRVLSGELARDAGTLELDGEPYAPRAPRDARQAGVALVHQELALCPHLCAAENVALASQRGPWFDRAAARELARAALARLGSPAISLDRPVGELPLAARQLVEIARALASAPRVLVLDEPTSALGRENSRALLALVRKLAGEGLAVVYISHVLAEVFAVADRWTVLRDGRSMASGSVAASTPRELVEHMAGRAVGELFPRGARAAAETVLEIEHLGGERLPVDATFALRRGEVLGIAGLAGAGKSELLRAVFGLAPVRAGRVRVLALEGPRAPRERWRQGAGYASEDRRREGLVLGRSVAENLCLPRLWRARGALGLVSTAALERAAAPWIQRFGVCSPSLSAPAFQLSGGNQQKLALARLAFADCDVLLLDEPTRGVDVAAKAEIYATIDALAAGRALDGGFEVGAGRARAVLLASSDLGELLGVADRIAVMRRGRLGLARPARELDERALVAEMTGADEPEPLEVDRGRSGEQRGVAP
jgi:ribose transport system ATP-binding protein